MIGPDFFWKKTQNTTLFWPCQKIGSKHFSRHFVKFWECIFVTRFCTFALFFVKKSTILASSCEENDKESSWQRFRIPLFWAHARDPCLSWVVFWRPLFVTPTFHPLKTQTDRWFWGITEAPWREEKSFPKTPSLRGRPPKNLDLDPFSTFVTFCTPRKGHLGAKRVKKDPKNVKKRGRGTCFLRVHRLGEGVQNAPVFALFFTCFFDSKIRPKSGAPIASPACFCPKKPKNGLFWPFFRWLSVRVMELDKK